MFDYGLNTGMLPAGIESGFQAEHLNVHWQTELNTGTFDSESNIEMFRILRVDSVENHTLPGPPATT